MEKYGIADEASKVLKSKWKGIVKEKIRKETEKTIRAECETRSKGRTVMKDEYTLKQYFKETTLTQTTQILMTRLHMTKLPCNYKNTIEDEKCWLCGGTNITTEHYFKCPQTESLKRRWNTRVGDLQGAPEELARASDFISEVEKMLEPKWNRTL